LRDVISVVTEFMVSADMMKPNKGCVCTFDVRAPVHSADEGGREGEGRRGGGGSAGRPFVRGREGGGEEEEEEAMGSLILKREPDASPT
jgi:hypothetical protein